MVSCAQCCIVFLVFATIPFYCLKVKLLIPGVRAILQFILCAFTAKKAIKVNPEDIEETFGIEGFYKTIKANTDLKQQTIIFDHLENWSQYIFISFVIFSVMDILVTISRMALGHSVRKSAIREYKNQL
uniref:Uncharacterized protein n=1 Tax=Panagrolaimus sp. PS1159 TaxID=55785 RepID=A0AC35FRR5_9BILA